MLLEAEITFSIFTQKDEELIECSDSYIHYARILGDSCNV